MQRQKEQLQGSIIVLERNLVDANNRLATLQDGEDRRQAASFLVAQVRGMQEDRETLIADNQHLAKQVQELLLAN